MISPSSGCLGADSYFHSLFPTPVQLQLWTLSQIIPALIFWQSIGQGHSCGRVLRVSPDVFAAPSFFYRALSSTSITATSFQFNFIPDKATRGVFSQVRCLEAPTLAARQQACRTCSGGASWASSPAAFPSSVQLSGCFFNQRTALSRAVGQGLGNMNSLPFFPFLLHSQGLAQQLCGLLSAGLLKGVDASTHCPIFPVLDPNFGFGFWHCC